MEASALKRPAAGGSRAGLGSARLLRVASDERLVDLVRQGSQPAFEVLYDRHHRGILSFCRHMLASREEAEDAVQHTFMAAYRDLVGSDKAIQLRAWLYAIARNRCLSILRARRERPVEELEDVPTEGLATEVQRRADLQALLRDLAALPEDQRAALVLAELGDLSHDDVAAVIGCRREKVKALVFQARSSLNASREARDTDCAEVRELLSTLSGGALRRTTLRRHLKECAGCRGFRDEVERQRRAMAVVLPVVPTLGLKAGVLDGLFGSGAAAGAAAAAGGAAAAGSGVAAGGSGAAVAGAGAASSGGTVLAAKALVVAVALGGGTAGVKAATDGGSAAREGGAGPAVEQSGDPSGGGSPTGTGGSAPTGGGTAPASPSTSEESAEERRERRARAREDRLRGKDNARTRGRGDKHGLNGTQPGAANGPGADDDGDATKAEGRRARREERAERKAERRRERAERKAAREQAKAERKAARPDRAPKPEKEPKPEATPAPTPKPAKTPRPVKTPKAEPTSDATPEPTAAAVEPTTAAGGQGSPSGGSGK